MVVVLLGFAAGARLFKAHTQRSRARGLKGVEQVDDPFARGGGVISEDGKIATATC